MDATIIPNPNIIQHDGIIIKNGTEKGANSIILGVIISSTMSILFIFHHHLIHNLRLWVYKFFEKFIKGVLYRVESRGENVKIAEIKIKIIIAIMFVMLSAIIATSALYAYMYCNKPPEYLTVVDAKAYIFHDQEQQIMKVDAVVILRNDGKYPIKITYIWSYTLGTELNNLNIIVEPNKTVAITVEGIIKRKTPPKEIPIEIRGYRTVKICGSCSIDETFNINPSAQVIVNQISLEITNATLYFTPLDGSYNITGSFVIRNKSQFAIKVDRVGLELKSNQQISSSYSVQLSPSDIVIKPNETAIVTLSGTYQGSIIGAYVPITVVVQGADNSLSDSYYVKQVFSGLARIYVLSS